MIDQRQRGAEELYGDSGLGFGYTSEGGSGRASSVVSDSPRHARSFKPAPRERNILNNGQTTSPESQPMFFRADDLRPNLASIPSERCILQEKASSETRFGTEDGYETDRSPLSISPQEGQRSKFLYANGTVGPSPGPSKISTRSLAKSPTNVPPPKRATSPLKDEIVSRRSSLSMASPRRHTRLLSNPAAAQSQDIRAPEALSMGHSGIPRSSSVNSPGRQRVSHIRSPSVNTIGPTANRRSSITLSEGHVMNRSKIHPVVAPVDAHLPSPQILDSPNSPKSLNLMSPKSGQSKLEHMNELAANARRDRKVLDLEISNSSLLAINRTLEREMRKQNAELRRFRQPSRTSRLSLAPSSRASKSVTLLSETDDHIDSDDYSDQSSADFPLDANVSYDDNDSYPLSSSNILRPDDTPLSQLQAARVRDKDSKRLRLDFSRNRALLIESQKLNQSLKRCLSRTEGLIADGKKALEYRVEVHDAGTRAGKVLLPDELEESEIGGQRQGLLSPGIRERKEPLWEGRSDDTDEDDDERQKSLEEDGEQEEDIHSSLREDERNAEKTTQTSNRGDEAQPDASNEWDRIKSDIQTPDEIPGGGAQGLREYLSNLGHVWLP